MKKIMIGAVAVLALAGSVFAGMDDVQIVRSIAGTATVTNDVVIRGNIAKIYFKADAAFTASTNTVTITSDGETILSKAFSADATVYPSIQLQSTTGVSLTNGTSSVYAVYRPTGIPVNGKVRIVQANVGVTQTNNYTVKFCVEK